jgi:hypothetical protein
MDHKHQKEWPLPFGDQPELDLRSGSGDVVLVPLGPGEEAHIEATGEAADHVDIQVHRAGNVVRVEVGQVGRFRHSDEDTHIYLYVPPDVRARIHTTAGSIEARDLGPCELEVETGAGRIALSDVHGRLRLRIGAGQIAGRGLRGRIDIESRAGAVLLEIEALDPGEHHIKAGAGAVRIELARGLDARVEARSDRGSVRNEYPARQHATAVLYVSAETGSMHIR